MTMMADMEDKLKESPIIDMLELQDATAADPDRGDSRPVKLHGRFEHAREMLVGPRQHEGQTGYHVITPFRTEDGQGILVNRGWISKSFAEPVTRSQDHTQLMSIFGLVKRRTAHNMFTPENDYNRKMFYFVDIPVMSDLTNVQPLLIEETLDPTYSTDDYVKRGVPVGKPHAVLLQNNHMQYIITW